ncbi:MAG TPA: Hsp20/alpha crystallin family protein [Sulfuricella sp.]|nr:Hsp20/alpha crystallin family protein [Sulfuricella sp.]
MTNIKRYDPFDLAFEPFDDVFRGFFRPVRFEGVPQQMQIRLDIKESDKDYTINAEIPGVKKDDIHVTIDGNQVSISAEVKKEEEEKEGGKVLRSERYYGKVFRSFTLGSDVDDAAAKAKYTDGLLKLTLPKKAGTAARKLSVQ